ncbi:MAG: hypothetical protein AB1816_19845 [Bacillota bacterium]
MDVVLGVVRLLLLLGAGIALIASFRAEPRERRLELLLLAVLAVMLAR